MPTRASMPWFQLDARDYLSDEKIDAMPQEAVGLLVRVWCLCWIEGSAPADQDELCRKTRCRLDYVATHIVDILPFFEVRDRRLYSLRMERQKHLSAVRAASGKKGFAASKFLPVQTGGLPRQLFAERSSALPGQTDGLPEQKGDLPGKLPNPLPSNPLGSKNKNDANSEKAPDGLNGFQYAAALLEKLGTVQTRTLLPIVVEAIGLLAKDEGITEADATDLMELRGRAARDRGMLVNRFWFEDEKWRKPAPPPPRTGPPLVTDGEDFKRRQRERDSQMRDEAGAE